MWQKISHIDEKTVPERLRRAASGKHPEKNWQNCLPVNLREITMEEFAQSEFFSSLPTFVRFNQCPLKKGEASENFQEFWYDDGTGFALVHDYREKKVRVFRFGCDHTFASFGPDHPKHGKSYCSGRCMHNEFCTKCDTVRIYDSSD